MSDDVSGLLTRAADGQEAALAELYVRLRGRVVGLCRHLLRSPDQAEDAAADVLLRLRRLSRDYDGRQDFAAWVLRVAANLCIDRLRRRSLERRWLVFDRSADAASPEAESPLSQLLADDDRDRLRAAIQRLPDHLRVVLVLRYFEDLSYQEIGERLDIPAATVGTYLFRAKQALRVELSAPPGRSHR